MAKTITYDTLRLEGANIWVDSSTGSVRLEVNFRLLASLGNGPDMVKRKDLNHLLGKAFVLATLPPNPTRQDVVLALTQALQTDLVQEELG